MASPAEQIWSGTVPGSGGTSDGRCGSGSVFGLLALACLLSLRGGQRGSAGAARC
jgi:hypothetical protein